MGDKGYAYANTRAYLRRRGIGAVIPSTSDQRRNPRFDREAYRLRNRVKRCFNRLKRSAAVLGDEARPCRWPGEDRGHSPAGL